MKKLLFPVLILIACSFFTGCIKDVTVTTPVTYMNVTIGSYIFNTQTVYPTTLTLQFNDTTKTLQIIGEQLQTKERIVLQIDNYKGEAGTFSIAGQQALATYYHTVASGTTVSNISVSIGGFITITKFTPDCMVGYFNFDTQDGLYMTNGTFSCPIPGYVAHP